MLTYFILVPILIATFLYIFSFSKAGRIIALCVQGAFVGAAYWLFTQAREGDIITNIGNYESILGITLRADQLSSLFVLLTAFIFLIAAIYSFNEKNGHLFWSLFFIWQGALIGLFLVRDFFNIFVLLEVLTLVISVAILFHRSRRSMYEGMVYLMINIVATQFYLFGVGYIYMLTGAMDMDAVLYAIGYLEPQALYLPYALIMTAVAFKCAILPLFSWLPKAHGTPGAPSSVSALLSGLQIKSGLYLFLRVQEIFYPVALVDFFLFAGVLTGIVGIILALAQTDIKLILAYSTVAQIGLILIGFSLQDSYAYLGSLYHIVNHALFKAALFLSAGLIQERYKSRDLRDINGLMKQAPLMGVATLVAILGITGTPLFNGSISKYFIMSGAGGPLTWVMIGINLGTILIFIKYGSMLVRKSKIDTKGITVEKSKQISVLILAALCFIGGIWGEQMIAFLFHAQVGVDAAGYLEKTFIYFASWAVGLVIYQFGIREKGWTSRVRVIDLNFRGMCASLGLFFAILLGALHFWS